MQKINKVMQQQFSSVGGVSEGRGGKIKTQMFLNTLNKLK
jgi:hypothetical protein